MRINASCFALRGSKMGGKTRQAKACDILPWFCEECEEGCTYYRTVTQGMNDTDHFLAEVLGSERELSRISKVYSCRADMT